MAVLLILSLLAAGLGWGLLLATPMSRAMLREYISWIPLLWFIAVGTPPRSA